ncbi:uncharacterized protein LOC115922252 [Strongylocentrotus purpuratus]|uniref:Uncharacterized protein n=1 Tax=Strongylocentrotus purpuratus TaxID=7668 RepID=A0A7M7NHQ2_STRPU|nr:uncharacterized protein LOC115922252 [Strongylocentrotus purpuratus]
MHTENFKFQRKGNEEQHKVNVKIHRKLKEAEDCLNESNDTSGAVAGAKGKIVEGIDLVEKRQKLIKMADSSPLGWKLVAEYERNTLADDSEDEKRMLKAETRAERKGKKVKKMAPRRFQPYDGSKASWNSNAKEQEFYSSIRHGPGGSILRCLRMSERSQGYVLHAGNRDTGGTSVRPGQAEISGFRSTQGGFR